MKASILLSVLAIVVLVVGCDGRRDPAGPTTANTLIVFVDTLRSDHVGAYGYEKPTTPFIDELAAEGARFENAYATSPWTYPSAASLFTGLYPAAHGAVIPGEVKSRKGGRGAVVKLDRSTVTLAEAASAAGLKTAFIARNGYLGHGLQKGFETYRNKKGRNATKQTDLAIEWLEGLNREDRFFMVVHYMDVHRPSESRVEDRKAFPEVAGLTDEEYRYYQTWVKKYASGNAERVADFETYRERRIGLYDAAIRYVDAEVRRLVEALGDRADDTTVIFLSDHGEEFWEHRKLEAELYDLPRGKLGVDHGHTLFEELLRIPLIVHHPGAIEPRVVRERVSLVDVFPTVTELMGIPNAVACEGISLAPALLRAGSIPERPLIFDAVRWGHSKQGILYQNQKLVRSWGEPSCLFDIENDPAETENLHGPEAVPTQALEAMLDSALQSSRALGETERRGRQQKLHHFNQEELERLRALGYVDEDEKPEPVLDIPSPIEAETATVE